MAYDKKGIRSKPKPLSPKAKQAKNTLENVARDVATAARKKKTQPKSSGKRVEWVQKLGSA